MTPDPETTDIFDQLWDARIARVDTQLEKIANTAYWLGRKLARHEITRDDVNRRLMALTAQRHYDDETWVPAWLAEETATNALSRGMKAGR